MQWVFFVVRGKEKERKEAKKKSQMNGRKGTANIAIIFYANLLRIEWNYEQNEAKRQERTHTHTHTQQQHWADGYTWLSNKTSSLRLYGRAYAIKS